MSTATDRFLRYVAERDHAVLEDLLREHAAAAHDHALRLLGNASDADDAVQEAMVRLVRGADRYDGSVAFAAWFARLVQLAALDVRRRAARRQRRERTTIGDPTPGSAFPAITAPDHAETVRRAVADLPDRYRAPIDLHYFAGMSQEQTAQALGLSTTAVAARIHRGKARLRDRLARLGVALPLVLIGDALLGAPAPAAEPAAIPRLIEGALQALRAPRAGATVALRRHLARSAIAASAVISVIVALGAVHGRVATPEAASATGWVDTIAPATSHRRLSWDFSAGAPADIALDRGSWSHLRTGGPDGRGSMLTGAQSTVLLVGHPELRPPLRITCRTALVEGSPLNEYSIVGAWTDYRWVARIENAGRRQQFASGRPWVTTTTWLTDTSMDSWVDGERATLRVGERLPGAPVEIYVFGLQELASVTIEEVDDADVPDHAAFVAAVMALAPESRGGEQPLPLPGADADRPVTALFESADARYRR